MKQRLFQKIRAIFANAAPVQVVSFARPVGAYASWIGGASDAALDESYCRGAVVRVGWKDVETSPGVYSWTALDGYVNDCKSRGKKWTLAVGAGTPGCPQWVTDGASQTYTIYFRPQDNPDPFTIAAGWDTYYLSRLQSLMTALAARYGSDPDLQMVYVPQQTGNGIEGHFNANTDSSLTAQGINATSWVQCSKQAAHIVAAAFPNKSVAFEVHKVISSHAIPMQIVEEMHAETSGQVGAAMWWLKGNMTEQSGLIDALYTYAGNIYAQPIGNSGDASRFPTSADYLAVITQAMELGCLYVEFWDYEYLNDTFPTNIAQYNAWCDGSIATVYSLYAVATGNDVAITWENPHVNDHSVIVQRNGATIATLSSGSTSYSDNDLASGSYTYRVYIEQHGVVSDWVSDSVVVAGSGASGGTAALAWSAPDGLINGGNLTITTDGTYNFGAIGPTLVYYDDYSGFEDGEEINGVDYIGTSTLSPNGNGYPIVDAIDGMPMGKALRVSALGSERNSSSYRQFYITTPRHHEFFEFYISKFKEENLSNATPYLDANCTWQIKPIWHYEHWSDIGKSDIFFGYPTWYTAGQYWTGGTIVSSNSVPTSTFSSETTNIIKSPSRAFRTSRITRENWVKCSPIGTQPANSDGMSKITDELDGVIAYRDYYNNGYWDDGAATVGGFYTKSIPGFVRGFLEDAGAQTYFGQIYETIGPGSCSRVVIGDNADYWSAKNLSICTVDAWANGSIELKLREGVFYQAGVVGLWFYVFDSNNDLVCSGRFL